VARAVVAVVAVVAALATSLVTACTDRVENAPGNAELVLRDVTVVNPTRGRRHGAAVHIAGEVVTNVTDSAATRASQGLERYAGAFVLPGLIDMHVHQPSGPRHAELFYLAYLAYGVTTVRDTGNFDDTIFTSRARIAPGEIRGPRVYACGTVIDGEPPFWRNSLVVRDPDEARSAVAAVADAGADCVKAYQGLPSAAVLDTLYEEASTRGLPVVGHGRSRLKISCAFSTMARRLGVSVVARASSMSFSNSALQNLMPPLLVAQLRLGVRKSSASPLWPLQPLM